MRKHYSPAFKAQVVLELLKGEKTIAQIASEQHVHPTQLNKWKAVALKELPKLFTDDHKAKTEITTTHQKELDELYAEIGRLTTHVAWLKKKSGLDPESR